MKNKGFFKTAAALLAALVLLGGFSVTAYAGGGEDIPTNDSGVIVETEPQPLTPDGNLSLIDDIEGEPAEDKQFIIVQSKNGNYFYIIVDRAAEGENTVHFLNQVDEADLMALMEDGSGKAQAPAVCTCKDKCKAGAVNTACPVCSVNMTECAGKEAVPEPDDAPPEKEKSNAGGLVIFLVVTLLAGGGAFYYFKIMKPKQGIKDSWQHHAEQTLEAGDFRGQKDRVDVLCRNAYPTIEWLESLGMQFKPKVIQIFGALYPRSHVPALPKGQGYGTVLSKAAKELGVEVRTGMGVEEIIREKPFEGDVLGVIAKNAKGEIKRIRATRGVVLAAGGFSANKYLRELHDPRVAGLGADNLPGATGEVAMAAVRVGGYLVGMDFIQSTPGAPAGKKMKLLLNFNVNGSIYVDKRGARIVNEGARRDVIRDAVLGTPERYAYTVCDNENFTSYDEVNRAAIMKGIEAGEAWTAPTIRELAQKMGVDPDGLEKTIKRYNDVYVKNQKDEDFGKTAVNLTKRIDQGPFWACYTGMTVHHTMGGLNTNVKAQVLDWTGSVIPRLYAAGEITGGIHGTNRVGGNAVLDCFVFGQIAGENASQETIAA